MSDFDTMAQQGLVDCREASANIAEYKLAIIDSCIHHQPIRFWFSGLDFTITAPASTDVEEFGLSEGVPNRVMYLSGDIWVDVDGDTNNRHQVVRRTPGYLELLRSHQAYTNWPEYYAIKEPGILLLWPGSDDAHTFRFRGFQKIPAPRKAWDGSAWVFPDGDDFTNEWFNEAERSVREYANYLYLGQPTADPERARTALARHLEARADLMLETESRLAAPRADPWPAAVT